MEGPEEASQRDGAVRLVTDSLLIDQMNCTVRFCELFSESSNDLPAMLYSALLPRQGEGTLGEKSVLNLYVRGILSLSRLLGLEGRYQTLSHMNTVLRTARWHDLCLPGGVEVEFHTSETTSFR